MRLPRLAELSLSAKIIRLTFSLPSLAICGLIALSSLAQSATPEHLFVAEFGGQRITKTAGDGSDQQILHAGSGSIYNVRADHLNRKIYWSVTSMGHIRRSDYDGSNAETLVQSQSTLVGLQLDLAGGKMYWCHSGGIRRANLDGTDIQEVLTVAGGAEGLELDLQGGYLFVAVRQPFPGKIIRATLDGSNVVELVTNAWSSNLEIDPSTGILYYGVRSAANASLHGVFKIDGARTVTETVDHSTKSPLIQVATEPVFGLALDVESQKIYFTSSFTVYRADLDGTDVAPMLAQRQAIHGIELAPRANRIIATAGNPAPSIPGATFRSFGQAAVNRKGEVAFEATLASTSGAVIPTTDKSIWSTLGGAGMKVVAREGTEIPALPGISIRSWSALHMADALLVFRAKLSGSGVAATNDDAICCWDGDALSILAREGDVSGELQWVMLGLPSINDQGQVLFSAKYLLGGQTSTALFRTEPGGGAAISLIGRGLDLDIEGTTVTVASFTQKVLNAPERLLSNTGYTAATLKLTDGRTVLAVIVE